MIHPILRHPHPVLRTPCAPVEAVTHAICTLGADMLETMYAAPGRGLAAPQIGRSVRMFVMDVGWKEGTPTPLVAINPSVAPIGDEYAKSEEGCLSIPGVLTRVTRPARVQLHYTDTEGRDQSTELTGFAAACAQHEIDHLDGILTLDHLTPSKRTAVETRYGAAL